MQRVPVVDAPNSPAKTQGLLDAVTKQMGGVPNILAAMAQSGAALDGYLSFSGALAKGSFTPALREQVALAIAGANTCDDCASVHTALGQRAGIAVEETRRNLLGLSSDPKVASLLASARLTVDKRGRISDSDLSAFRAADFPHVNADLTHAA